MIAKVKGKGNVPEAAVAGAAPDARARTELRRPRGLPGPRPASSRTAAPSGSSGPGKADLQSALGENQALRDSVSVPFSSVRAAVSEWELLTEDKAIIKVIKNGVDIPLVQIPQPLDLLSGARNCAVKFSVDSLQPQKGTGMNLASWASTFRSRQMLV